MARPGLPAAWLARAIANRSRARRASPLARPRRLGEQVVGGLGVGPGDRVVGLEQAAGEGVVDLGEPVLAVAGQQRLGLGAGQRLGRRRARPAASSTAASSKRILAAQRPFGLGLQGVGQDPPRGVVRGPRAARRSPGSGRNRPPRRPSSPRAASRSSAAIASAYRPSCIAATTSAGSTGAAARRPRGRRSAATAGARPRARRRGLPGPGARRGLRPNRPGRGRCAVSREGSPRRVAGRGGPEDDGRTAPLLTPTVGTPFPPPVRIDPEISAARCRCPAAGDHPRVRGQRSRSAFLGATRPRRIAVPMPRSLRKPLADRSFVRPTPGVARPGRDFFVGRWRRIPLDYGGGGLLPRARRSDLVPRGVLRGGRGPLRRAPAAVPPLHGAFVRGDEGDRLCDHDGLSGLPYGDTDASAARIDVAARSRMDRPAPPASAPGPLPRGGARAPVPPGWVAIPV